jgi:hypothetical protein
VLQKSFRIAAADPGAVRDNALAKLQSHRRSRPNNPPALRCHRHARERAFIDCPSSNGLGQSELFGDGGSGSFGLEFRRLSTDVAIVAV